jgi:ribosomal protein S18 acetylase RimI-like enzyme
MAGELRVRAVSASPSVRPFAVGDEQATVPLLYESSGGMYDRLAGNRELAERTLTRALDSEETTASADVVWVAALDGEVVAAMAVMPYAEWTPRAHRFLRTTLRTVPPWRWPRALWLYRSSGRMAPEPTASSLYIDSLATAAAHRRRGIARAMLDEAERMARRDGLRSVALDTWQDNRAARALYLGAGFEEVAYTPAGGALPGGVSLVKELGGR